MLVIRLYRIIVAGEFFGDNKLTTVAEFFLFFSSLCYICQSVVDLGWDQKKRMFPCQRSRRPSPSRRHNDTSDGSVMAQRLRRCTITKPSLVCK